MSAKAEKALDETTDLLLRFSNAVDAGLFAKMRAERHNAVSLDKRGQADRDLKRAINLVSYAFHIADELVAIAARYQEQERAKESA